MSTSQVHTKSTLVVSGASGKLGQKVIGYLLNELSIPADQLIALTRTPENLAELAAQGVRVRAADFDKPDTLPDAFAGGERALLISTDALDEPGKRVRQHNNAIEAAQQAGVKHLLYTSMPEPEESPLLIAPDHWQTEQAIYASGLSYSILRNNWYFENIFLDISHILASGVWPSAAGTGKLAHLAHDDAAKAAAYALAADDFTNQVYTLTGSQAFTVDEQAQLLSQITGKAITVAHMSDEEKVAGMVEAGLPEPVARVFESFDTNTRAGGVAQVTEDFHHLTGQHPISYQEWLANMKQALLST